MHPLILRRQRSAYVKSISMLQDPSLAATDSTPAWKWQLLPPEEPSSCPEAEASDWAEAPVSTAAAAASAANGVSSLSGP